MSPWPEPMYGQCACGASMTVDHIRNHCPLRSQQSLSEESLLAVARAVFARQQAANLDVSHVAVLGEN